MDSNVNMSADRSTSFLLTKISQQSLDGMPNFAQIFIVPTGWLLMTLLRSPLPSENTHTYSIHIILAFDCVVQLVRYFIHGTKLCVCVCVCVCVCLYVCVVQKCSPNLLPCWISTITHRPHSDNQRAKMRAERSKDGQKKTEKEDRGEQESGRWEETQEAFARQESWISIPCRRHTNTHIHKERGRERKRQNDSLMLPTMDDAKMIIMPESLQWCQNPLPFPVLGDWPIQ